MLTKEAVRGAIIGTGLFNETEGCMEVNETSSNSYGIENTVVFLDNEYQPMCIYANAKEGYIKRPKLKKYGTGNKEETVRGKVLILFCSEVVRKLLRGDYERE